MIPDSLYMAKSSLKANIQCKQDLWEENSIRDPLNDKFNLLFGIMRSSHKNLKKSSKCCNFKARDPSNETKSALVSWPRGLLAGIRGN